MQLGTSSFSVRINEHTQVAEGVLKLVHESDEILIHGYCVLDYTLCLDVVKRVGGVPTGDVEDASSLGQACLPRIPSATQTLCLSLLGPDAPDAQVTGISQLSRPLTH